MTPSNANTLGLAPCPFCGGEAWLNEYEAKYSDLPPMSRAPQCRSCGVSLGYLTTPAKATEAWNRRVTAASAQARIAALEAELEREKSKPRWSVTEFNAITESIIKSHAEEVHRATAAEASLDEIGMLVRMLVQHVPENKQIRAKALDYLSRHNLMGSPFRDDAALQQEG